MNWMAKALEIAQRGKYSSKPNPMVGCIIVKNNQLVGQGAHLKAGDLHSECIALAQAGSQAEGAEVYVTLEPCSHYGCQAPCVDALIKAKVQTVHVAILDPNPHVNGQGVERLRQAGIQVHVGECQEQAYQLNEIFFHYITQQKPFVIAKWAMSLDGKIATFQGHSKWITGEKARQHVHEIRRHVGAIMVGAHTVRLDNPYLTVRGQPDLYQPRPVVITKSGNIPFDSHIFSLERKPIVITCSQASASFLRFLEKRHICTYELPLTDDHIAPNSILKTLAQEKISNLLIEGGSCLLTAFFKAQEINRFYTYIGPKIIGGVNSLSPIEGEDPNSLCQTMSLRMRQFIPLDEDICIQADSSLTPRNYNEFLTYQGI